MLKNVALKKILKSTVFKAFTVINKVVPKDDSIVLLYTANGGIQHALIPIRKYLIDNNYTNSNKIYCAVNNKIYYENDGCTYISQIKAFLIFLRARHVFYTAGQIPIKPSKNQIVLHLGHGSANFKTYGLLTNIGNGDEFYFTHRVLTSKLFVPYDMKAFGCLEENEVVLGDVMVDMLQYPLINRIDKDGNLLLLWLPTFRQSRYLGYSDSSYNSLVPLFGECDYEDLNAYLKMRNVKIIVKLHDMQVTDDYQEVKMSNFILMSNSDFKEQGIELYPLLNYVDGLIGDYSSVSMQYYYTNKPQAFVVPDIDEYKETRGFLFDKPEDYMGGWIIKSPKEFYDFIDDISEGIDRYKGKRETIRKEVFEYDDYNNCKRVIEFSGIKRGEQR